VIAAAVVVMLVAILLVAVKGLPILGGNSGFAVYGAPEKGKTLALVHVGGKIAYFPGVVCESGDPEIVTVSLGARNDPVSFYLSVFLGPQSADGRYVSPVTSLVVGHRPGISFDQDGRGAVRVSPELQTQLISTRPSAQVTAGTMTFHGTDRSGMPLDGTVACSP
jgi:hypothetical protein